MATRDLRDLLAAVACRLRFNVWGPMRVDRHASFYLSHSQFGEDMLLRAILGDQPCGFYVDLGAHHPVYLSNTHRFYRRGWRGLNVDCIPGSMKLFDIIRPRDINVEAVLGMNDGEAATVKLYENVALTTTQHITAKGAEAERLREISARTVSLKSLLDRHLPSGQHIDLMSIDLEGSDGPVLRGNDWSRYRPSYLVLEEHGPYRTVLESALFAFLFNLGYEFLGKLGPSYVLGVERGRSAR
jgi:Methyltransferase FkbM domain